MCGLRRVQDAVFSGCGSSMNVTVRFGSVAVLKRRFRFMRFGFSDGSCGSVRGFWRFQSPSPKSVESNTFWSLGGMAAEPRGGVHNSGVWGLELAKRVLPRVLLGRGPPCGGVHNSEACENGTPTRDAGSTQFGALKLAKRVLQPGRGPELHGRVVWGPESAESVNITYILISL